MIMTKKSLVFLGGQDILRGVFDSHNIKFLESLYRYKILDFDQVIFCFICKRDINKEGQKIVKAKQKRLSNFASRYGFSIIFYQIPNRSVKHIFKTQKDIRTILREQKREAIIWAHNYYNGFIASLLKQKMPNSYFHLDLKGIPSEEEFYHGKGNLLSRTMSFLMTRLLGRVGINTSDSLSVVSERFKDYILRKYKYKKEIYIYPSVYDTCIFKFNQETREQMRKRYRIKDGDKVLFYSGSFQEWQLPEVIFQFLKNVENLDKLNKIKKFVFTQDIPRAEKLIEKYKIKNVVVKSLSVSELVDYLVMGDIGLICRKDDLVNNLASPTKIAEYIATKNSVILTESIGDYGLYFRNKSFAIVFKNINEFLNISYDSMFKLKKPSEKFLKQFARDYSEGNILNYKKIFRK